MKSWMKPEWQKRSKVGAENRKKVPGVEAGTSSYVRHTGGSANFGIHRKIMVCTCYFFYGGWGVYVLPVKYQHLYGSLFKK